MIQNTLQSVGGIGIYGTVSICLFIGVFGAALVLACRKNRVFLDHMGRLPLNDGCVDAEPCAWDAARPQLETDPRDTLR